MDEWADYIYTKNIYDNKTIYFVNNFLYLIIYFVQILDF